LQCRSFWETVMYFVLRLKKFVSTTESLKESKNLLFGPFKNKENLLEGVFDVFRLIPFGLSFQFFFGDTPEILSKNKEIEGALGDPISPKDATKVVKRVFGETA